MVIIPVISHTIINHPGEPTLLAISALTMKIPEPIMGPATNEIPSKRFIRFLRRLFSSGIYYKSNLLQTEIIKELRKQGYWKSSKTISCNLPVFINYSIN
jgi:hypothetical protein